MKILIVNTSDIKGGAARAAYRLHKSLLLQGVDSQMLVQEKTSNDQTVICIESTFIQRALNKLKSFADKKILDFYPARSKTYFSSSYFGMTELVKTIDDIDPDIVHLHWINECMVKLDDLKKINKPIVWSLHDMWAFTGGCHYNEECENYKTGCGKCKVLGSNEIDDLSRKIYKRKEKHFSEINNITIIGLSRWLYECSKSSPLLHNKRHKHLPNVIDTEDFKPFDKEKARELWNLPSDKKLILFGAIGATSEPRKGFFELSKALSHVNKDNIEVVIFGSSKPVKDNDFGLVTHYLGHLYDDISLVTLYSAVDVMVVPSLQENLSNAIMESLACGTPVVGFDIGGNSDMIDHKKTGFLAKAFDIEDLVCGIEWVLNNSESKHLGENARSKVLQEFDSVVVSNKYINVYKEVLYDK